MVTLWHRHKNMEAYHFRDHVDSGLMDTDDALNLKRTKFAYCHIAKMVDVLDGCCKVNFAIAEDSAVVEEVAAADL
jgi:hypothetical protein